MITHECCHCPAGTGKGIIAGWSSRIQESYGKRQPCKNIIAVATNLDHKRTQVPVRDKKLINDFSLTPVRDWNELFATTLMGERSEKPQPPSVDTMFPFTVSTFPVVLTSHTLVLSCSTTAHGPGYQRLSKVSLQVQTWWGTYWYNFSIPRQDSGACTLS